MHVSRTSFDQLVERAIAGLPEDYARWLDQIPIIVEDRPARADLRGIPDADDDEPLGLYDGGTIQEDPSFNRPPPRVMLYRIPLMEACDSRNQLADEIRKTLLHELGHHAGLDEDDLEAHGMGPMDDHSDDIDWDLDGHS